MKIISVNVGLPREILHDGKMIRSGIFKTPVAGRVRVKALNIDGDQRRSDGSRRTEQSDLCLSIRAL
jgi:MOSC domain-containing protein YiiM